METSPKKFYHLSLEVGGRGREEEDGKKTGETANQDVESAKPLCGVELILLH